MKLVIAGETDNTPTVAFRFVQDGNDVDVYANDNIFVGWFELDSNNKIRFQAAFISEDGPFARTETGKFVTL